MCFKLPALPSLEPHVDAMTMEIHHQRHHQTYVNGLNQALAETRYEKWDLSELLRQIESIPSNMQSAVRNHGGGHANHSLFWEVMSPDGGGEPTGNLAKAIETDIGGFKAFQEQFTQAAVSRFGSGWAWLVINANGQLEITSTANQDSPLMDGLTPILGLDVWEHAYYLKYQNKRADYIAAFYEVIHWPEVARRFEEHE